MNFFLIFILFVFFTGCSVSVYHQGVVSVFPLYEPGEVNLSFSIGNSGNQADLAFSPNSFSYFYISGVVGSRSLRVADTLIIGEDYTKESFPLYGELGTSVFSNLNDKVRVGFSFAAGTGKHILYTKIWTPSPSYTIGFFHRFSFFPYFVRFLDNSESIFILRLSYVNFYSILLPKAFPDSVLDTKGGDLFMEPSLRISGGVPSFRAFFYLASILPLIMKNNYTYQKFTAQIGFTYIFAPRFREMHKFLE